jgi:hypothetical protein
MDKKYEDGGFSVLLKVNLDKFKKSICLPQP